MNKALVLVVAVSMIGVVGCSGITTEQGVEIGAEQDAVAVLTSEEVMALGGTCFGFPYQDGTGDVAGSSAGDTSNTSYPEKSEYDTTQVTVGVDGDRAVFAWEFAGAIPVGSHHNIGLNIDQSVAGQNYEAALSVRWTAAESRWSGSYSPADSAGEFTEFEPEAVVAGNIVQFSIPVAFFTDGIDRLNLYSQVYAKQEDISYIDTGDSRYSCS